MIGMDGKRESGKSMLSVQLDDDDDDDKSTKRKIRSSWEDKIMQKPERWQKIQKNEK